MDEHQDQQPTWPPAETDESIMSLTDLYYAVLSDEIGHRITQADEGLLDASHLPLKNKIGAMERVLDAWIDGANELATADYDIFWDGIERVEEEMFERHIANGGDLYDDEDERKESLLERWADHVPHWRLISSVGIRHINQLHDHLIECHSPSTGGVSIAEGIDSHVGTDRRKQFTSTIQTTIDGLQNPLRVLKFVESGQNELSPGEQKQLWDGVITSLDPVRAELDRLSRSIEPHDDSRHTRRDIPKKSPARTLVGDCAQEFYYQVLEEMTPQTSETWTTMEQKSDDLANSMWGNVLSNTVDEALETACYSLHAWKQVAREVETLDMPCGDVPYERDSAPMTLDPPRVRALVQSSLLTDLREYCGVARDGLLWELQSAAKQRGHDSFADSLVARMSEIVDRADALNADHFEPIAYRGQTPPMPGPALAEWDAIVMMVCELADELGEQLRRMEQGGTLTSLAPSRFANWGTKSSKALQPATNGSASAAPSEHWFAANWYSKHTDEILDPRKLWMAGKRNLIRWRSKGKRRQYEAKSVMEKYPECARAIREALQDS